MAESNLCRIDRSSLIIDFKTLKGLSSYANVSFTGKYMEGGGRGIPNIENYMLSFFPRDISGEMTTNVDCVKFRAKLHRAIIFSILIFIKTKKIIFDFSDSYFYWFPTFQKPVHFLNEIYPTGLFKIFFF